MNKKNKQKLQFLIDSVAKFCDKCGTQYNMDDIKIIQESEVSSIIHFSCGKCKARNVATILRPVGVSSRMPVNTDLSVDEISIFALKPEVSVDAILDIYTLLEEKGKLKI